MFCVNYAASAGQRLTWSGGAEAGVGGAAGGPAIPLPPIQRKTSLSLDKHRVHPSPWTK